MKRNKDVEAKNNDQNIICKENMKKSRNKERRKERNTQRKKEKDVTKTSN
jgi:hypothetical protein